MFTNSWEEEAICVMVRKRSRRLSCKVRACSILTDRPCQFPDSRYLSAVVLRNLEDCQRVLLAGIFSGEGKKSHQPATNQCLKTDGLLARRRGSAVQLRLPALRRRANLRPHKGSYAHGFAAFHPITWQQPFQPYRRCCCVRR